jgi:hypothetical protein
MINKARPEKVSKQSAGTQNTDKSQTFKNICQGIAAVGTMIIEAIRLYLGL